ncbi:hypothetical protein JTE90_010993 [Oedothorax gibbosus]|uniref:Uncharacterized protein n=1 Tax=Oedothorax gibbosus TaxID=931172 RepID=A0AAV6VED2_9ARAC|nr:hypothetical protein JTE90_010993 [Oedothorax gibbosus]
MLVNDVTSFTISVPCVVVTTSAVSVAVLSLKTNNSSVRLFHSYQELMPRADSQELMQQRAGLKTLALNYMIL